MAIISWFHDIGSKLKLLSSQVASFSYFCHAPFDTENNFTFELCLKENDVTS
jgi:hypothetical protein